MLVSSGEAQLVTITVMANTELIIVTFLICVQSEEPHDLIYSVSNVRNTTQSLQWKCSGICIFFLCRCSQLKVFSDIKWIIEKIIWLNHMNLSIKLYWKAIAVYYLENKHYNLKFVGFSNLRPFNFLIHSPATPFLLSKHKGLILRVCESRTCLKAFVKLVEEVCSSARCPCPQRSFGRYLQQAAGVRSWLQSLQVGEIWTTTSIIPRNLCTTEVKSRILRNVQRGM